MAREPNQGAVVGASLRVDPVPVEAFVSSQAQGYGALQPQLKRPVGSETSGDAALGFRCGPWWPVDSRRVFEPQTSTSTAVSVTAAD